METRARAWNEISGPTRARARNLYRAPLARSGAVRFRPPDFRREIGSPRSVRIWPICDRISPDTLAPAFTHRVPNSAPRFRSNLWMKTNGDVGKCVAASCYTAQFDLSPKSRNPNFPSPLWSRVRRSARNRPLRERVGARNPAPAGPLGPPNYGPVFGRNPP